MAQPATDNAWRDPTRARILDAAEACLDRYGLHKTTVEDVAKAAEVSRATLYRYVPGGRDEIVLAVLMRVARRELRKIRPRIMRLDSFGDRVVEGVVAARNTIAADEHLSLLFSPEIVGYTGTIAGVVDELASELALFLSPMLAEARERSEIDTDLTDREIAVWILHIVTALLVLDGPQHASEGDDALRRMLRRFVVAGLQQSAD